MPQIEQLNSAYKQLSQNISDSEDDSDEDEVVRFQSPRSAANPQGILATALYSPSAPKLDNHPILMTPSSDLYLASGGSASCGLNGRNILLDLDGGTASDTVAILNEGGINSTNSQDDEVAGRFVRKPMGPCRRFCFCLSILVCFASVVIFLWGLPCTSEFSCPPRHSGSEQPGGGSNGENSEAHNWIRDFERVEFKSVISVTTNGMTGPGKNIIFIYR